ncbi:DUF4252 domain-containing protein [Flavobacterium salilacus subsp. salilacus]|uniref:DUF4252 domain-containing protein n=1 Tax=Flavobacterium TaxID=237 RepID=UPI001074F9C9|nr:MULTISPECIES: DUF4252 domain-containing protein [Flavobacterium]KAF2518467.1 DUF4252 domain-containing protein [Flavobacterium salilacus subsp. salilacus]MBE1615106.1 DUF4252 domain-containing protein [Flavobacterium sp. SaA2.13]
MKKIIITAILAAMPFATFAQTDFDKFQDQEGIDGLVINENLINILNYIKISDGVKQAEPYLNNIKETESFRVFTTSEKKHSKEMKKTVKSYLKKHPMEQVVAVNDKGTKVNVYMTTSEKSSQIRELIVFTENEKDDEVVLVSFIGNVDLEDKKVN